MFTTAKNKDAKEASSTFDQHIAGFSENINEVIAELADARDSYRYKAPELMKNHLDYMDKLRAVITAQEARLETLQKMKKGEPVSKEEFDHLMKVTSLTQDQNVAAYSNITKPAVQAKK